MRFHSTHITITLRGVALLLAALLALCLVGCSDQVYDPTQGTLILNEGTGQNSGNGNLELPTEPPTGSVIVMPSIPLRTPPTFCGRIFWIRGIPTPSFCGWTRW